MIPRHEHSLLAYIYVIWEVRDRLFLALIEYVMPNMIRYDLQLLNRRKFPINAERNKNEQKKFNRILFSDGKILELLIQMKERHFSARIRATYDVIAMWLQ